MYEKWNNHRWYIFSITGLILFFIVLSLSTATAEKPSFYNIKLWESTDMMNWSEVNGILETGFTIVLNKSIPTYYLDVKYADTNVSLAEGFYGFNLTSCPPEFIEYWEEQGVNESAPPGSWQEHMRRILNGSSPFFYLRVETDQKMHLIDGLQRDWGGNDSIPLMLRGDYPLGLYIFNGTIVSEVGNASEVSFHMKFVSKLEYMERTKVADISLVQSTDQINWKSLYGSLRVGYSLPINSSQSKYYLNVASASFDPKLSEGFYGFYLVSFPPDYLSYWDSKGVNASAPAGTWEAHMWRIINGEAPAFYLYVDEHQRYSLIDALLKDYYGYTEAVYRINGDTPLGRYVYRGIVTSEQGLDSYPFFIFFNFLNASRGIMWVDDNYDPSTPGWNVTHFNRISAAINASANGTVIMVQPGTYKEVIRIDRPVILRSVWGSLSTIITDEDATYAELLYTGGQTVQIASDHVLLENFTIERSASVLGFAAVGNRGSPNISHVEIRGCDINSFYDCIYFSKVTHLSIISTTLNAQYDDKPVVMENVTDFVLFRDNLNSYNYIGTIFNRCKEGYVGYTENAYKRCRGIDIRDSSNISIRNTSFSRVEGEALYIVSSFSIDVKSSHFENNHYGISLGENSTVFIINNTFLNNDRNIDHAVRIGNQYLYYSEIQRAIDRAREGDSINIFPGNYTENLLINKSIKLYGVEGSSETIITGVGDSPTIFIGKDRDTENVVISGLTINGGHYCIRTGRHKSVSGLTIKNCVIKNPLNGTAVYIDPHNYSDESSVREGTYIFTKPVVIQHTEIEGGLLYQYWPYEVYPVNIRRQLKIQYCTIDSVFLNGSISVEIGYNNIHTLGMMYSRDVSIYHNTFENPWEERYGIFLWSINGTPPVADVYIRHNVIVGYTSFTSHVGVTGKGIVIAGARSVAIEGNTVRDCTDAIWLTEKYQNRKGEWCVGDIIDVRISNNKIENCNNGIKIPAGVDGLFITGNRFEGNGKGIWIHGSSYHVIANNTIVNNYKGIQLDENSSYNLIYNNYFDNIINAVDHYSNNRWNVTLREGINILGGPFIGGNYWSDYTGKDLNGDTIGDTDVPYNCSGNIAYGGDYLPIILSDITPPVVRVLYPNGGESVNGTITIRWYAYDDFDTDLSIDIFYSNDSGQTWHLISSNEENDGEFEWDTTLYPEGTEYMIKIEATDNAGNSANDTSDGTFAIYREVPGPKVTIVNPLMGYLYFFNEKKIRFLRENCFAIGHLIIEAKVDSLLDIEKVEFYVDDLLCNTSYKPKEGNIYSWKWDEPVFFYHEVKVVAYDAHGKTGEDMIGVTIFNFNIIP